MDLDCRRTYGDISSYKGILNALDVGIALYDRHGFIKHANKMALYILPDLNNSLSEYSNLIGFIYDHSIEYSEQSQLPPSSLPRAGCGVFNEIICVGEGRYYSVHVIAQDNEDLIIELIDISYIKSRTDDILSLGKNNRYLTKAIQSSEKGIFVAENRDNKKIVFANKAMNRFFSEDVSSIDRNIEEFLSNKFPNDWNEIQKILDHTGEGYFWRVIDRENNDKQWLCLNLFVESQSNSESLIIGFISDETKNKRHENQLLQSQKLEAIGKLAGGIAHDFNNILSIVEGYIRLSETALKRGESITGNIERIKQAVSRGSGLTKQLLTFGKHRVKENEFIDVCVQVKEIEVFIKPLLGADIILKIDTMDTPHIIRANADSLSQIIMNLVINSRDAMNNGGEIIIRVSDVYRDNQAYVVLEVKDTGDGIPPDMIQKIFDPFFTTKEQGKGTGLGLSMVYGIVQQIEGKISVESVLGEGTKFRIEIPMAQDISLIDFKVQEILETKGLAGKTILIAEDEADLLAIMEMTLKEHDMHVLKANNGNEALAIQDEYEGNIDFLLTDMVMPELGGLRLAELIKEVRPETHILFMSGYPVRGEISNINLPDNSVFMAKPVAPELLYDYLNKAIGRESINPTQAKVWQNYKSK